jgi:hypothetical protein
MAAGLGFKTFAVGEILSAANVNGYLMQGVLVFANATARDAAITSPQEGQFAFTKDNDSLWYYSGSAWVSSGATGDIEGVTAGTGISGGGTSGTVTVTNSMATAIDAKGDLIVGTGADTFSRLAAGTNTYILTADSAEATGLKWAAPAGGGGKVLQVIQDLQTGLVQTTSTSFQSTGLSVSITPSSATSKILVLGSISIAKTAGANATSVKLQIKRGATAIMDMGAQSAFTNDSSSNDVGFSAICFLDSPSTTSATTYAIEFASSVSGQTVYVNNYGPTDTVVSSIVVMEIGA